MDYNLKLKKYYKRISSIYPKVRLQMASSVCVSDLIQSDQMSIKVESSRNITNVSAMDPKVRLPMATSICVSDLIQIDQMSIKIQS